MMVRSSSKRSCPCQPKPCQPTTPRPCGHSRAFIAGTVIPFEQEAVAGGVTDDLRIKLQELARAAGAFTLQAPLYFGGGCTDFQTTALMLEEAGYSLLGQLAMNCAAPGEGNMHLLSVVASPEPPERYLRPLVAGRIPACRALLREAALWSREAPRTEESSTAKVFISEATSRIVDRLVQLAGRMGVTEDSVIGLIYADIRAFRIYDGPSEAHRAAIARRAPARVKPRE